jgi:hypothetical protein
MRSVQAARMFASSTPRAPLLHRPHRTYRERIREEPLRGARATGGSRGRHVDDSANVQYLLIDRPSSSAPAPTRAPSICLKRPPHRLPSDNVVLGETDPSSAPTVRSAPSPPVSVTRVRHSTRSSHAQDQLTKASLMRRVGPHRRAALQWCGSTGPPLTPMTARKEPMMSRRGSDIRRTSRVRHLGRDGT